MRYIYAFIITLFIGNLGFGQATDLFISEYGEGSSGNSKYIEIYNGTGTTVNLANYELQRVTNGGSFPEATLSLSGNLVNGATYVVANNSTDTPGADLYNSFCGWNGNDAVALATSSGTLLDVIGDENTHSDPGSSWQVGTSGSTKDHRLVRKSSICSPNSDASQSLGTSDALSEWTYASYSTGSAQAGHTADCSGGSPITSIEFASASASVSEGVGTTDLTFSITNPDGTNATSFDVELTTGDSTDINGYTTQTVTFAAGSSTDETLTITVTDDTIFEGDETLTFTITGVSGGNNATLGTQSTFDLTIEENDSSPAITIVIEDFDGTYPNWNNDIESQLFVDPTTSNEGLFIQPASSNNSNFSGNTVFGRDLDGETNEPTLSPYTFTFDDVDVSDYTSVTVSFDYHAFANAETGDYEIVINGVGQGSVQYFNDPDTSPGVNGTISVSVVDGTSTVGLILTGTLNGGSDIIEFDNFKVEGIYNGYAYSEGSWYPEDPDGTTGASDAIIADGTAVLSTNASLNQVIIKSGASLTINQGVTLTANTLDLESTSSSYASLINNGTITGTITYNRYTNTIGSGSTGGNDLIASPFSGQTFGAFATANDGVLSESGTLRAFAPFNTGSGNYENYDTSTDNATEIEAGTGYRAATDSGESLAFSGTLNSGDITVSLSDGASSYWNLIGNVYPSYLDLGDFLATNDNTIIQDAFYGIYGYDANASDGSVFTIWDLNTDGDFLIAPGQGFFVAAPSGGGTSVTFTDSMRRTGAADDFIVGRGQNNTGVTRAGINLNTASKSYVTNFYFRDINTLGLDPGYDTGAFDQASDGLFSNLIENDAGIALVNQSLPLESLSNVSIPLVVNATAGEQLNFSLDSNTSLPANIEVYLEDILTGTSTLLNTSDYIFTPTSNLSGPGRFYVVFSDNALGVNEDTLNNVNIYALERELFIKGQLAHNTNATLFDMQGRAVLTVSLDTESQINTIDISGLSNGIYIVQLSNIEYSKSKKVILK